MTDRRALSDMLIDIADGVLGFQPPAGLRATGLEVKLPVEVEMARTAAGPEFRAELPRFVTRTAFDKPPSRLTVRWAEGTAP
ncbi:hypothetical protein [Glacieibacterium sp.]|uniref:hypothetical protein n=1 Tax=Glacieibacterium sp. TaxID=2860237 RepID=UPI003B001D36